MAGRGRRRRRARPRGIGLPQAERHRRVLWERLADPTHRSRAGGCPRRGLRHRRDRAAADVAAFLADLRDVACSSSDVGRALVRCPVGASRRGRGCRRGRSLTTLRVAVVLVVVELLVRWVPLPRLSRVLGVAVDLAPAPGRTSSQLPLREPARAGPPSAALHPPGRRRLAVQPGAVPAPGARRRPPAARARPLGPPRPGRDPATSCWPTPGSRSTAGRWRPSTTTRSSTQRGAAG